jgi:hypothetical protein
MSRRVIGRNVGCWAIAPMLVLSSNGVGAQITCAPTKSVETCFMLSISDGKKKLSPKLVLL